MSLRETVQAVTETNRQEPAVNRRIDLIRRKRSQRYFFTPVIVQGTVGAHVLSLLMVYCNL